MVPSDALRETVRHILGRTEDDEVLFNCIQSFALHAPAVEGVLMTSAEEFATEQEIITGAYIARAFTYMASRTYEGRPIVTGIMICSEQRCLSLVNEAPEELDPDKDRLLRLLLGEAKELDSKKTETCDLYEDWIIRFEKAIQINWADESGIEKYAQLVDGKHSILLGDTNGKIYGIIDISECDIRHVSLVNHGYCLTTSKNREVFLYYTWQNAELAASVHDGYSWGYQKPSSLGLIRKWLGNQRVLNGDFDWFGLDGKDPAVPGLTDTDKIEAFLELIEQLSNLRLSSIIVVCEPQAYIDLKQNESLRSLRPELDGALWGNIDCSSTPYVNVFRIDGAHFLSTSIEILAIAQQILVSGKLEQMQQGAGSTAAIHVSKAIGTSGIVVKVSSDGPIKVFQDGKKLMVVEQLDHEALRKQFGLNGSNE